MDRRELLGVLGATAAGVAVASGAVAYGQERKEGQKKGHQGELLLAYKHDVTDAVWQSRRAGMACGVA